MKPKTGYFFNFFNNFSGSRPRKNSQKLSKTLVYWFFRKEIILLLTIIIVKLKVFTGGRMSLRRMLKTLTIASLYSGAMSKIRLIKMLVLALLFFRKCRIPWERVLSSWRLIHRDEIKTWISMACPTIFRKTDLEFWEINRKIMIIYLFLQI